MSEFYEDVVPKAWAFGAYNHENIPFLHGLAKEVITNTKFDTNINSSHRDRKRILSPCYGQPINGLSF